MSPLLCAAAVAVAIVVSGPPTAHRRLAQTAGTPPRPGAAVALAVGVMAVVVLAPVAPVLTGGAAAAGAVAWRVRLMRVAARQRTAAAAATIEVTVALAAELRAGRTTAQALGAVADVAGPLAPTLRRACTAAELGGDAAAALRDAASLPGCERLSWVAAAWAVADAAGGRVALALERIAEAMDRDDEVRQELDAALAAPRATMTLLAGLPVLGVLLGQAMGARPMHFLAGRPLGWGLVALAAALDTCGVLVTRTIVRRALR
jgi:tight adherence protein B